jgi:hypothetical protein
MSKVQSSISSHYLREMDSHTSSVNAHLNQYLPNSKNQMKTRNESVGVDTQGAQWFGGQS